MNTMIEQDLILLIMNCKKYADKALLQKTTWLRNIPSRLKYYHVIGDEELGDPFKFEDENNILWLKVGDDYNSLPKKVIAAYQAIYDTYKFAYIFKTDDDQMLVNIRFFDVVINLIANKSPIIHYGGHVVDVPQSYLSQYHRIHPELPSYLPVLKTKYCSGRFYFLSREAIDNLLSKSELICKEFLEDYAIGYNLPGYYKENMLKICTDNSFKDM
jgi:hypothetical protein